MKFYLWAFCAFYYVSLVSSASLEITTLSPFELEEDSTELIVEDFNNDDASELSEIDVIGDETTVATSTTTSTTTEGPDKTPKMVNEPDMIHVFTLGEPFVLVCSAESEYDPNIKYTWTKNGSPFNIDGENVFSESSQNGNILFPSPSMSDIGTYQCEAHNSFGKSFSQASLLRTVQNRDQPRRLTVNAPVSAQVLIDPNVEDKDLIERVPITQAVPESLPTNFVDPVFVVLPAKDEPAFVMDMQSITNQDQEVTEDEEDTTQVPNN